MNDTNNKRAVVLIPAYKPDERLIDLTRELIVDNGLDVLLVDDGGQEAFAYIFEECRKLGAEVAVHAVNMGKGRALKTGSFLSQSISHSQEQTQLQFLFSFISSNICCTPLQSYLFF